MAKGSELTQVKLVDNLKKKIKLEFINLVPEAEWNNLITETITEFKTKELKNVLREELRIVVKEILTKHINEITNMVWDNTSQRQQVNNELRQMILSMAPELLTNMVQGSVQYALEQLRNNQY